MSPTSRSPNSIALLIRSLSSLSMSPSSSASSIMEISSSSVIPGSSDFLKILESSFCQPLKIMLKGKRIILKKLIMGAENKTNFSGEFLAIVLGEISPKISITTVSTAVETVAARSGLSTNIFVNNNVAIADARMFTMLLPISIVEIRES